MKQLHSEDPAIAPCLSKVDVDAGLAAGCDGWGNGSSSPQASGYSEPAASTVNTLFPQGRKAPDAGTTGQEEKPFTEFEVGGFDDPSECTQGFRTVWRQGSALAAGGYACARAVCLCETPC